MQRDIPRNAYNRNDKFRNQDWMIIPHQARPNYTTFVDVDNIVIDREPKEESKFKDMSISEMLEFAINELKK